MVSESHVFTKIGRYTTTETTRTLYVEGTAHVMDIFATKTKTAEIMFLIWKSQRNGGVTYEQIQL